VENRSRTTLTSPRAEKWRDRNAGAVARVASQLAETERLLGYALERPTA